MKKVRDVYVLNDRMHSYAYNMIFEKDDLKIHCNFDKTNKREYVK